MVALIFQIAGWWALLCIVLHRQIEAWQLWKQRKKQVPEGERVVEQCQFSLKTLWTAGPWEMLSHKILLDAVCVWCYSQERVQLLVQLLLVWNPRKMSLQLLISTCTSCGCLRCESDTHILLPYSSFKWHIKDNMFYFLFFFPIDVCYFSTERRCMYEFCKCRPGLFPFKCSEVCTTHQIVTQHI